MSKLTAKDAEGLLKSKILSKESISFLTTMFYYKNTQQLVITNKE